MNWMLAYTKPEMAEIVWPAIYAWWTEFSQVEKRVFELVAFSQSELTASFRVKMWIGVGMVADICLTSRLQLADDTAEAWVSVEDDKEVNATNVEIEMYESEEARMDLLRSLGLTVSEPQEKIVQPDRYTLSVEWSKVRLRHKEGGFIQAGMSGGEEIALTADVGPFAQAWITMHKPPTVARKTPREIREEMLRVQRQ